MIVRVNNQSIDTDGLSYEEAQKLLLRLDEGVANIEEQIRRAAAKTYETGNYADPDWFNKATFARKALQRSRQALQVEVGQKRKKAKHSEKTFSEHFVDVARERLDEDLFHEFLRMAEARKESL